MKTSHSLFLNTLILMIMMGCNEEVNNIYNTKNNKGDVIELYWFNMIDFSSNNNFEIIKQFDI